MSNFTETDIRAGAIGQSYARGEAYYRDGAVLSITRRGGAVSGDVEGSDYEPYQVTAALHADGSIRAAECSCPYEMGGYCKHIVATLLAVLRDADDVEVKPDVDALLAGLSEAQLRRVLAAVAAAQPAFADAVEQEVKWLRMEPAAGVVPTTAAAAPAITVDMAAIRRELRKDLRGLDSPGRGYRSDYYYDDDEYAVDLDPVLEPHLATVEALLAAGDAATATDVLVALIEEWGQGISGIEEWIYESNEETFAEATQRIDALLAEALLSQELSPEQRAQW